MKKVVLSAAIFDLLHNGHIRALQTMRDTGRMVVVVLHDDRSCYEIKGKIPVQNIKQRIENLKITGLVDWVIVTHSTDPAYEFLKVIRKYPNVLFMRADDNKNFPGKWIIDKYNIPIKYWPYMEGVSSTKLRKELIDAQ